MKRSIALFLIVLALNSCGFGEGQKTVTVDNRYSISIPSFLIKTTSLNNDASLQYQNTWKVFCVIVIDEPKSDFGKALVNNDLADLYSNDFTGYSELLLAGIERNFFIFQKPEFTETFVNDMPARLVTIAGHIAGNGVFCSFAFIEGKDRYYQIMAWTSLDKKDQYKERMNKIIYSLIEL